MENQLDFFLFFFSVIHRLTNGAWSSVGCSDELGDFPLLGTLPTRSTRWAHQLSHRPFRVTAPAVMTSMTQFLSESYSVQKQPLAMNHNENSINFYLDPCVFIRNYILLFARFCFAPWMSYVPLIHVAHQRCIESQRKQNTQRKLS